MAAATRITPIQTSGRGAMIGTKRRATRYAARGSAAARITRRSGSVFQSRRENAKSAAKTMAVS